MIIFFILTGYDLTIFDQNFVSYEEFVVQFFYVFVKFLYHDYVALIKLVRKYPLLVYFLKKSIYY